MLFGDKISQWFRTFMAHRTEDAIRKMMGMPTRKEERKARRNAEKNAGRSYAAGHSGRERENDDSPLIPKEYAEDVEFYEIRDYSATETIIKDERGHTVYHESQVEEAVVIEEIKN